MATRLYLRSETVTIRPSAGEKSTALPVGTGNSNAGESDRQTLLLVKGAAQFTRNITTLAQTAHQDGCINRFTSSQLLAQTLSAETWTIAVCGKETNAAANARIILSLYVWRPSTPGVVGFVYDSDSVLGTEWTTSQTGQVVTFAGASVTAIAGDILVLEFWYHAVQGSATAYTNTLYFDGTTDVTSSTTSDAASYLEKPATITFVTVKSRRTFGDLGTRAGSRGGRR